MQQQMRDFSENLDSQQVVPSELYTAWTRESCEVAASFLPYVFVVTFLFMILTVNVQSYIFRLERHE